MASVFKRKGKWIAAFKGADGLWHQKAAGTDKSAALQIANAKETAARFRREGLVDMKADAYATAERKSIADHLEDYRRDLLALGRTGKHADITHTRVKELLNRVQVAQISDLKPAAVNSALLKLREEGYAVATCAHYLRACKMFSRWLLSQGRTREDAIQFLKVRTNAAKADRVWVRRALDREEFELLIKYVVTAGTIWGMVGADRVMLYKLAANSGLRSNELRSLKPENFNLEGDSPAVTVQAGYSKRGKRSGRDDVQPIPHGLAGELQGWLGKKAKGRPIFALPAKNKIAGMLRQDVESARVAWLAQVPDSQRAQKAESDFLKCEDRSGHVLDFHTFRHSYISWLVDSGASVKVVQELARHSTPVLTLNIYSHSRPSDQHRAIESLPSWKENSSGSEIKTTGTDGKADISTCLDAQLGHKTPVVLGLREAHPDTSGIAQVDTQKTLKSSGKMSFFEAIRGKKTTGRRRIQKNKTRIFDPGSEKTLIYILGSP